jgi:nucleoside-diphosphate-sugar epimerase
MSRFIYLAIKNEPITIYGDGSQTRTFFYIDDNVEATTHALNNDLIINDVVNIGGDHEITMLELAETIIRKTGSSSEIIHLPPLKEGDMTRRFPDTSKLRSHLMTREPVSLEDGIQRILDNPDFLFKNGKASNGFH